MYVVCFCVQMCGYAKLMWSTLGHNVWYAMSCPISTPTSTACGTPRHGIQVPSQVSTPWAPPSQCNCGEHCCQQKNEKSFTYTCCQQSALTYLCTSRDICVSCVLFISLLHMCHMGAFVLFVNGMLQHVPHVANGSFWREYMWNL